MSKVKIYTADYCPYCKKAKNLLASKGVEFEEIDVTNDENLRTQLVELSEGRKTVPQIFIDEKPVGGYTDLEKLNVSGHLDLLLNKNEK